MKKTYTMMIASTLILALPLPGQAQARCADHATVVDRLAAGYGETRQSIGLGSNNEVVEVFASLETGTWTIAVTRAGGPTCLVASGEAFQHLAEAPPNRDPGA